MGHTTLFEANVEKGKKNRGVHQSGAKSWTITAKVPRNITADFHTVRLVTDTVEQHVVTVVVNYLAKNTGNATGGVSLYIGKLNADGSVIGEDGWDNLSIDKGKCLGLNAIVYDGSVETYAPYVGDCATIEEAWIKVDLSAGTHYIGVRTWGEDESRPSYPRPTAALAGVPAFAAAPAAPEKWCTPAIGPIPEICLESWQWGVVAGAGVVAGVLTYAGVRAVKGKPVI